MTDTQNTPPQTPPATQTPQKRRLEHSQLAYDLTAKSLSTCAGETLGKDHPAADLEIMTDGLVMTLIEEGTGETLLRREAQTLDATFHTLLNKGLEPDEPDRLALLALALRAQKQASDTMHTAHMMPYTRVMQEYIASKPSETLADLMIKREKRYNPSDDIFLGKQTGLGKNDF
jgi:hypothetical protein